MIRFLVTTLFLSLFQCSLCTSVSCEVECTIDDNNCPITFMQSLSVCDHSNDQFWAHVDGQNPKYMLMPIGSQMQLQVCDSVIQNECKSRMGASDTYEEFNILSYVYQGIFDLSNVILTCRRTSTCTTGEPKTTTSSTTTKPATTTTSTSTEPTNPTTSTSIEPIIITASSTSTEPTTTTTSTSTEPTTITASTSIEPTTSTEPTTPTTSTSTEPTTITASSTSTEPTTTTTSTSTEPTNPTTSTSIEPIIITASSTSTEPTTTTTSTSTEPTTTTASTSIEPTTTTTSTSTEPTTPTTSTSTEPTTITASSTSTEPTTPTTSTSTEPTTITASSTSTEPTTTTTSTSTEPTTTTTSTSTEPTITTASTSTEPTTITASTSTEPTTPTTSTSTKSHARASSTSSEPTATNGVTKQEIFKRKVVCRFNGDIDCPSSFTQSLSSCDNSNDQFWALVIGNEVQYNGMKISETIELQVCDTALNNECKNRMGTDQIFAVFAISTYVYQNVLSSSDVILTCCSALICSDAMSDNFNPMTTDTFNRTTITMAITPKSLATETISLAAKNKILTAPMGSKKGKIECKVNCTLDDNMRCFSVTDSIIACENARDKFWATVFGKKPTYMGIEVSETFELDVCDTIINKHCLLRMGADQPYGVFTLDTFKFDSWKMSDAILICSSTSNCHRSSAHEPTEPTTMSQPQPAPRHTNDCKITCRHNVDRNCTSYFNNSYCIDLKNWCAKRWSPECKANQTAAISERGTNVIYSYTETNRHCQRWSSQFPHKHGYGYVGNHNHCRNPDGKAVLWCFTMDPYVRWEFCFRSCQSACIDSTKQCARNKSPLCMQSSTSTFNERGMESTKTQTKRGRTCQHWNLDVPHGHAYNDIGNHNKCLNPDNDYGPWCYTKDTAIRHEQCYPTCEQVNDGSEYCEKYEKYEKRCNSSVQPTTLCQLNATAPKATKAMTTTPSPTITLDTIQNKMNCKVRCAFTVNVDVGLSYARQCPASLLEQWSFCYKASDRYWALLSGSNPTYGQSKFYNKVEIEICDTVINNEYSRLMFPGQALGVFYKDFWKLSGITFSLEHVTIVCLRSTDCPSELCKIACRTNASKNCTTNYNQSNCINLDNWCAKRWSPECIAKETTTISERQTKVLYSYTETNHPCQNWSSQTPHRHEFGYVGDHNHCQNPDGKAAPWCFTTDPQIRWEFCFRSCKSSCIDSTKQCFNQNKLVCQSTTAAHLDERGVSSTKNMTKYGRTCQNWSKDEPHSHSYNAVGDHNYCRNPDGMSVPWCYTTDPFVRWEICFPLCEQVYIGTGLCEKFEKTCNNSIQATTVCERAPPNVTSITDKPSTPLTTSTTTMPTTTWPCELQAVVACKYDGDKKCPPIFTQHGEVCSNTKDKYWALIEGKNATHGGDEVAEIMELRVCDTLVKHECKNKMKLNKTIDMFTMGTYVYHDGLLKFSDVTLTCGTACQTGITKESKMIQTSLSTTTLNKAAELSTTESHMDVSLEEGTNEEAQTTDSWEQTTLQVNNGTFGKRRVIAAPTTASILSTKSEDDECWTVKTEEAKNWFKQNPSDVSCSCKGLRMKYDGSCQYVNECEFVNLNECDKHSSCIDTIGYYYCKCDPGYKDAALSLHNRSGIQCTSFCNELPIGDLCIPYWLIILLAFFFILFVSTCCFCIVFLKKKPYWRLAYTTDSVAVTEIDAVTELDNDRYDRKGFKISTVSISHIIPTHSTSTANGYSTQGNAEDDVESNIPPKPFL